jgi:hypothetical protein
VSVYKVQLKLKGRKLGEGQFIHSSLISAVSFDRIFMNEHGELAGACSWLQQLLNVSW